MVYHRFKSFLARSKRCRLFKELASQVWSDVIMHHQSKVDPHEDGITNRLIAQIRRSHLYWPNVSIWANRGQKEDISGSDIDIFVETKENLFVWWALQAKVLKQNGRYSNLKKQSHGTYQWEKLDRLSQVSGCIPKYLFYNGVRKFKSNGIDGCHNSFNENQFGCSLVDIDVVENFVLSGKNKFTDYHPDHTEPWRIIVCCYFNNEGSEVKTYTINQVKNSLSHYESIVGDLGINDESGYDLKNDRPIEAINNFSDNVRRNPKYRFVIRRTNSIKN